MISALDTDVLWKKPEILLKDIDSVILGGSGEFHFPGHTDATRQMYYERAIRNSLPLVRYLLANDIPTLGICFGHQMLGYALGSRVIRDPHQAKTAGSYVIHRTEEAKKDVLFSDLPDTFFAQYAHQDSLEGLPKDCVLLAHNGAKCRTSAFRYKNNIYSFQFHPELDEKEFFFRLKISDAEYSSKKITVHPTQEASELLRRFVGNLSETLV
jgi:GMP synthase-like glutamine amidotransferase